MKRGFAVVGVARPDVCRAYARKVGYNVKKGRVPRPSTPRPRDEGRARAGCHLLVLRWPLRRRASHVRLPGVSVCDCVEKRR